MAGGVWNQIRGMEEYQKVEQFKRYIYIYGNSVPVITLVFSPKSEGNGPPHVTHSRRRLAFIATKHIVYRMGRPELILEVGS